jgi:hypothetical protein
MWLYKLAVLTGNVCKLFQAGLMAAKDDIHLLQGENNACLQDKKERQ